MEQVKQAAIKAVIYGDIFNYPLTAKQLWEYGIAQKPFSQQNLSSVALSSQKKICNKDGFYFLCGRESLIDIRLSREQASEKKLNKARHAAHFIAMIPTICFIGVSGSVSMKNATESDDIDLFFITEKRSVWITRLLVILLLGLTGNRRKKNARDVSDTVCANMFLDKEKMVFSKEKQNIYIAHEIVQTIPLFSLGTTYADFINGNAWISAMLPNWKRKNVLSFHPTRIRAMMALFLACLEPLVRVVQRIYMEKSRTTEVITNTIIAFHPNDQETTVMTKFFNRCKQYDL